MDRTSDWLHNWAERTPDAVFIAQRSGTGWREVTYAEALQITRNLAIWLLDQGLEGKGPIAILSGNSVDHGLLSLAAQYAGLATAPVAEQYSLIPGAHDRLVHVIELIQPGLLFTDDAARYGEALMLPALKEIPVLTSRPDGAPRPVAAMQDALRGGASDVDAARAAVTPDTLGKVLFTSGSTSHPKGGDHYPPDDMREPDPDRRRLSGAARAPTENSGLAAVEPRLWRLAQLQHDARKWRRAVYR